MVGSIDIHSSGYVAGGALGRFLMVGGGAGLVWWLTRRWRNPVAATPEEVAGASALGRKRRRFLGLGLAVAVTSLSAAIAVDATRSMGPGPGMPFGSTDRTVTAPGTVAGYHLITAHATSGITPESQLQDSQEKCWFYSKTPGGTEHSLLFCASTVHGDQTAAATRADHSYAWLFENYFAAVKVGDAEQVDAGPLGGQLRCGHTSTNGFALCHWEDASNTGTLVVTGHTAIPDTAAITLQFRESAEY
ncbi:hypothetical protein [Kitasatospora cinereorecta]|uniref:Serine/threonine protein kinase n=1 Tax=Kitasatospora cinereorecta TaxID=285560 RepID=A0ABW0VN53_9ACTN